MSESFRPWLIGDPYVLLTAPEEDNGTAGVGVERCERGEPGLADSGLPRDERDAELTLTSLVGESLKAATLSTPTHIAQDWHALQAAWKGVSLAVRRQRLPGHLEGPDGLADALEPERPDL